MRMKVGPEGLTNDERVQLLSDPVALGRLHEQVWNEGHPEWLQALAQIGESRSPCAAVAAQAAECAASVGLMKNPAKAGFFLALMI